MNFFTENIIRIVGWTFVHSLWLGLAFTMVAALVVSTTRYRTPTLRYGLLNLTFFSFLFAIVVAFLTESTGYGLATRLNDSTIVAGNMSSTSVEHFSVWIDTIFVNYGDFILFTWMSIIAFKTIKLIRELNIIHQLRHSQNQPVAVEWQKRFSELKEMLGVKKQVALLESALVQVPVVLGHLKPVILVPAGLFTQLSLKETESVLLHELAHIRRNDYLVNFIQRIAEMLFFFNPAVLWISSLLRAERENCCDDIAIANTNDRELYVNALIKFREITMFMASKSVAFAGRKNQLLQRVTRIVYNRNNSLSLRDLSYVCFSFIAGLVVLSQEKATAVNSPTHVFAANTTPAIQFTNPLIFEAAEIKSEQKQTIVTKPVQAKKKVSEHIEEIKINSTKKLIEPVAIAKVPTEKTNTVNFTSADIEQQRAAAELNRREAEKMRAIAEVRRNEAEAQRKEAEALRKIAEVQRKEADIQRKSADQMRTEAMKQRKEAEVMRQQARLQRAQAGMQRKQAELARREAMKNKI